MPGHTIDIEDLFLTPDCPGFIPGIFNYCNRRCERCAYTGQCRVYADEREQERIRPGSDWTDRVHDAFARATEMIKAQVEGEGMDFEELRAQAASPPVVAQLRRMDEIRHEPLVKLAEAYAFSATRLTQTLDSAARFNTWPDGARDALDTVSWYALQIAAKVHRAVSGLAAPLDEPGEGDPVQNDWNGSAKVARLAIAESIAAWRVLLQVGGATAGSPVRRPVDLLAQLDADVAARFPRAMDFVRPGFDSTPTAASDYPPC